MAEIIPPPLDAYVTAKPNEPTWTVQGGDPLGPPLLRVWAVFARLQAGCITPGAVDGVFTELRSAANNNPPDSERENKELLIRATKTEEVSWDMDSYLKGRFDAQGAKTPTENSVDISARLDLHDARVHIAERIRNAVAELADGREELLKRGGFFCGEHDPLDEDWLATIASLKSISDLVEPRRLFKRGPSAR